MTRGPSLPRDVFVCLGDTGWCFECVNVLSPRYCYVVDLSLPSSHSQGFRKEELGPDVQGRRREARCSETLAGGPLGNFSLALLLSLARIPRLEQSAIETIVHALKVPLELQVACRS